MLFFTSFWQCFFILSLFNHLCCLSGDRFWSFMFNSSSFNWCDCWNRRLFSTWLSTWLFWGVRRYSSFFLSIFLFLSLRLIWILSSWFFLWKRWNKVFQFWIWIWSRVWVRCWVWIRLRIWIIRTWDYRISLVNYGVFFIQVLSVIIVIHCNVIWTYFESICCVAVNCWTYYRYKALGFCPFAVPFSFRFYDITCNYVNNRSLSTCLIKSKFNTYMIWSSCRSIFINLVNCLIYFFITIYIFSCCFSIMSQINPVVLFAFFINLTALSTRVNFIWRSS